MQTGQGVQGVVWSQPGYRRTPISPGTALAGVVSAPKALCGIQGHWNCVDVYLGVDVGWLGSVVTLFAEMDGLQVPIDRKLIAESDYAVDANGDLTALVFSVRGHPCSGWTVQIEQAVSLVLVPRNGTCRMFGWGQDTAAESPRLCPRRYTSSGLEDAGIVNGHPTKLLQLFAINGSANDLYLQLYDRATVAPNAEVPDVAPLPIVAGQIASYTFNEGGWRFETGCVWGASTTLATMTNPLADVLFVSALHRGP